MHPRRLLPAVAAVLLTACGCVGVPTPTHPAAPAPRPSYSPTADRATAPEISQPPARDALRRNGGDRPHRKKQAHHQDQEKREAGRRTAPQTAAHTPARTVPYAPRPLPAAPQPRRPAPPPRQAAPPHLAPHHTPRTRRPAAPAATMNPAVVCQWANGIVDPAIAAHCRAQLGG